MFLIQTRSILSSMRPAFETERTDLSSWLAFEPNRLESGMVQTSRQSRTLATLKASKAALWYEKAISVLALYKMNKGFFGLSLATDA